MFSHCFNNECVREYSLKISTPTTVSGTPSMGFLCKSGYAAPGGMG